MNDYDVTRKKDDDPYAAYKAMGYFNYAGASEAGTTAPAPNAAAKVNTGNNSTVENSNDRLNNNHVTTDQVAGAGGAGASIQAGRESQQGFGGNQQGFTGGQGRQSDGLEFNPALQQRNANMTASVIGLFPNVDTSTQAGKAELRERVGMMNEYARRGTNLDAATVANMDIEDVQTGRRKAVQAKLTKPEDLA